MTESHAVMFEIETAQITPTENLMLEALAARRRLGERMWPFERRHRHVAERLAKRGAVGWKSGIVQDTILVWFAPGVWERYAAKVQYVPADRRGGVW